MMLFQNDRLMIDYTLKFPMNDPDMEYCVIAKAYLAEDFSQISEGNVKLLNKRCGSQFQKGFHKKMHFIKPHLAFS